MQTGLARRGPGWCLRVGALRRPGRGQSTYRRATFLVAAVAAAAFITTTARAQENGAIRGTVTLLENGDPVAGAAIRVTETNAVSTTDDQGAFEIAGLPTGLYEVLAERLPLATGRQVVTVAPGAAAVADFALQVAVQETVRVAARLPGYETDTAAVGRAPVAILDTPSSIQVVDRRLIEDQAAWRPRRCTGTSRASPARPMRASWCAGSRSATSSSTGPAATRTAASAATSTTRGSA